MSLVQPLPEGALDIIGDVHGEIGALQSLINHLGYDEAGIHSQNRRLVFVGDLCDRGPDSPAVIMAVKSMVQSGRAFAIIGNHELNLLANDAKDGSGWYFEERIAKDTPNYAPIKQVEDTQKQPIYDFLAGLPLALERSDLRIVHATWHAEAIHTARGIALGEVSNRYHDWRIHTDAHLKTSGLLARHHEEKERWKNELELESHAMQFLDATSDYDVASQIGNPLKILTSGVERRAQKPFFSSGKWRFSDRVSWWNEYQEKTPVIVGHYWRSTVPIDRQTIGKGDVNLFEGIHPHSWHGLQKNVFCVDFSVGARWRDRKKNTNKHDTFKLAALRWPERELVFDSGERVQTN